MIANGDTGFAGLSKKRKILKGMFDKISDVE